MSSRSNNSQSLPHDFAAQGQYLDASSPSGRAAEPVPDEVPTFMGDTIRMPGPAEERVVRPALAILYRLAVGPNADHYASRFLAVERDKRLWPGWNWPAFLVPPAWAAYRGLWLAAFGFAMLPLLAALVFLRLSPVLDGATWFWEAGALLAVWAIPSCIAGACANFIYYRRVRWRSLAAERETAGPVQAAARVNESRSTSWLGAAAGAAAMILTNVAIVVDLTEAHRDHIVRRHVLDSLDAVRGLEQQVEANWMTARLVPRQTVAIALGGDAPAAIEDVNVDPVTGRMRVQFGTSVPELSGKAILLAPTRDNQQRVRWLCVAIDIAREHLPPQCRWT